jgi:23S rRNA (guanosine2251-2'-O)-methyltransferase
MSANIFQIRKCMRPSCGFRFPENDSISESAACPKCGSPTTIIVNPYQNQGVPENDFRTQITQIDVLLDNIRSSFNVGSIFRTADGAGISKIHLCGITPPPDNPKVAKTALGAEFTVPWEQHWDSLATAASLKDKGLRLWALEGGEKAQSLFESLQTLDDSPILLIVGNEISGIDPGIIDICEKTVYIPMLGVKQSLNVSIAFGIAAYFLRFGKIIT